MPTNGEAARRAVHFAMGGLAFVLPCLTPRLAACAAGSAVVFNLLLLPRLAPSLFRRGEIDAPWRSGIVIYPVAVLLLVLLFHRRMEIAGAVPSSVVNVMSPDSARLPFASRDRTRA